MGGLVGLGRSRWGERALAAAGVACGLAAAALAAYFLLTFDWATRGVAKIEAVYQLGLWMQAVRPAVPVPQDIHQNVAAAGLAVLLPLGLGGLAALWRVRRFRVWRWLIVAALGLVTFTLVMTMSRGAWLGLAAGALVAAYTLWRSAPQRSAPSRQLADLLLISAGLGPGSRLRRRPLLPHLWRPVRPGGFGRRFRRGPERGRL